MRRCVVMYNSSDVINVTLLRDGCVLANFVGKFPLDSFLMNTDIEELDVLCKPTVWTSVPENGFKLSTIEVENQPKTCVVSKDDVENLINFSSIYGVKKVNMFNILDLVSHRFERMGKILVLVEWTPSTVGIVYLDSGKILDFKVVNVSVLTSSLSKMRARYGCGVEQFNDRYDMLEFKSCISNIDHMSRDKIPHIAHVPFVIDSGKGVTVLDRDCNKNVLELLSSSVNDDLAKNLGLNDEDDLDLGIAKSEVASTLTLPKSNPVKAFFGMLFGTKDSKPNKEVKDKKTKVGKKGKKDKGQDPNNPNSNVDTNIEPSVKSERTKLKNSDDNDDEYFSQLAKGPLTDSVLRNSRGHNPSVRKSTSATYVVIYSVMGMTMLCIVIMTLLNFAYVGNRMVMAGVRDSVVNNKNLMETSVRLAEDPNKSPALKISQIDSIVLPKGYKISNIDFSGTEYTVTVGVSGSNDINVMSTYIPKDLIISTITPIDYQDNSGEYDKFYKILLLTS